VDLEKFEKAPKIRVYELSAANGRNCRKRFIASRDLDFIKPQLRRIHESDEVKLLLSSFSVLLFVVIDRYEIVVEEYRLKKILQRNDVAISRVLRTRLRLPGKPLDGGECGVI